MDSSASCVSMESIVTTRTRCRRRPFHTCGVSIFEIAQITYTKSQEFNGPLDSMLKKIAKLATFASPLVYALQYYWLPVLSLADDHILAVEDIIEALFPPSNYVFTKIDELVQITEHLPGKFDDAINKFPVMIHQVPFLDWALVHLISWLNFVITTLTHWGTENTREKEIMVDINCNKCNDESASVDNTCHPTESPVNVDSENKENFLPISDNPEAETNTVPTTKETETVGMTVNSGTMKSTYKEALEKGTKEDREKKEDMPKEEAQKADVGNKEAWEVEEKNEDKSEESIARNDPILELFEPGWLMNPGKRVKGGSLSRSVSYT